MDTILVLRSNVKNTYCMEQKFGSPIYTHLSVGDCLLEHLKSS